MEFSRIDIIGNTDRVLVELNKQITKNKYNGTSRGDEGEGWSVTDVVTQFRTSLSAPIASCILSGTDTAGRMIKRSALVDTMLVKLRVLSRQACFRDAEGNRLLTNPTSPKQVLSNELPVEGDKVRVSQGPKMSDEITGKSLTFHQRNRVIAEGKQLKTFVYYDVDAQGCIEVPLRDAMALLQKNGIRVAFPEFGNAHTRIKDEEEGEKRRITNWLFEEVSDAPVIPELTAGQKAALTRQKNKEEKEAREQELEQPTETE